MDFLYNKELSNAEKLLALIIYNENFAKWFCDLKNKDLEKIVSKKTIVNSLRNLKKLWVIKVETIGKNRKIYMEVKTSLKDLLNNQTKEEKKQIIYDLLLDI